MAGSRRRRTPQHRRCLCLARPLCGLACPDTKSEPLRDSPLAVLRCNTLDFVPKSCALRGFSDAFEASGDCRTLQTQSRFWRSAIPFHETREVFLLLDEDTSRRQRNKSICLEPCDLERFAAFRLSWYEFWALSNNRIRLCDYNMNISEVID